MSQLFCFGLGYSAGILAARLAAEGWRIAGTTRDPAKADVLRAQGYVMHLFDGSAPMADAARALAGTTHLVTSISPDEATGDPVLRQHLKDLGALPDLVWCAYLSTTAVYGDRDGEWVDEGAPVAPSSARGKRRVAAEGWWLASGLPAHVFRLAGIYGPGRSPLENVRRGTARRIIKPGQVFSRIHVEDIAAVLHASIERPNPGAIYNVCDDEPAPPQDVIAHAAELLGAPLPPAYDYATAELSPMARSFYADNRRVDNTRIKQALGVRLAYPSYREGLAALRDAPTT